MWVSRAIITTDVWNHAVIGEKEKLVDLKKFILLFLPTLAVSIFVTYKKKMTPTIVGFPFL
jgi:hypothetical protein